MQFDDRAPMPGALAPALDLPTVAGVRFQLADRIGCTPVLVTFGALTCPFALGALDGLRALHRDFEGRVELVTVYVRELHPGERHPQPKRMDEKLARAREWVALDRIPWTVAVDAIGGDTHRAWGLVPAPAFLVGTGGVVAWRSVVAAPSRAVRRACERLLDAEGWGRGPVVLGTHPLGPLGFVHASLALKKALARGGARARADYLRVMDPGAVGVRRFIGSFEDAFSPLHR